MYAKPPSLFFIIQLSICLCFACNKHSDKESRSINPNDCTIKMPYIVFESVDVAQEKVIFHVRDTFSVADWNFYDEAIFYLWDFECLGKNKIENSDSVVFIFHHDTRSITRSDVFYKVKEMALVREQSKLVNPFVIFFKQNIYNEEFRHWLILLRHYYGKALDPNAKDGVMYNGDIVAFLLQLGYNCQHEMADKQDLNMLKHLAKEVLKAKGSARLSNSLIDFMKNCSSED